MLKNLLRIPDTFDPDERRRQVLNILLIFCVVIALGGSFLTGTLLVCCRWNSLLPKDIGVEISIIPEISGLIFLSILLLMNRSARVPSGFSGAIFILFIVALCIQADTPAELYNGRSTVLLVIPIMLGAMILPPGYEFLIALLICGMMQFFTHPDSRYLNPVNYYSMLTLLFIAFVSWLSVSIANQAIRDARRHAANLEAILNGIADGVLVLDLQGRFISANPALLRMIPEDKLREINTRPLEETMQWKQKVFSVTASPVPDVGSVVVFHDETRRHETERAKDALLATVSHELRTPLAAVMNYLELLLMILTETGQVDAAKFSAHLTRAVENCKRLQRLVNDILDQTQIQAGMLELKRQIFNLPACSKKTVSFWVRCSKKSDCLIR